MARPAPSAPPFQTILDKYGVSCCTQHLPSRQSNNCDFWKDLLGTPIESNDVELLALEMEFTFLGICGRIQENNNNDNNYNYNNYKNDGGDINSTSLQPQQRIFSCRDCQEFQLVFRKTNDSNSNSTNDAYFELKKPLTPHAPSCWSRVMGDATASQPGAPSSLLMPLLEHHFLFVAMVNESYNWSRARSRLTPKRSSNLNLFCLKRRFETFYNHNIPILKQIDNRGLTLVLWHVTDRMKKVEQWHRRQEDEDNQSETQRPVFSVVASHRPHSPAIPADSEDDNRPTLLQRRLVDADLVTRKRRKVVARMSVSRPRPRMAVPQQTRPSRPMIQEELQQPLENHHHQQQQPQFYPEPIGQPNLGRRRRFESMSTYRPPSSRHCRRPVIAVTPQQQPEQTQPTSSSSSSSAAASHDERCTNDVPSFIVFSRPNNNELGTSFQQQQPQEWIQIRNQLRGESMENSFANEGEEQYAQHRLDEPVVI